MKEGAGRAVVYVNPPRTDSGTFKARSNYDIKPEYYDHWVEALIETVKDLDPHFDREIELSWRLAVNPGVLYMKMHYEDEAE